MAFKAKPDEQPDELDIEVELSPEFEWRMRMLKQAGFPDFAAFRLSLSGADWHDAEKLLRDGCPIPTILDILLD